MKKDIVIFILGVLATVIVWLLMERHFSASEPEVVRDTLYLRDTVSITEPQEVHDTLLCYKTYCLRDTVRDTVPTIITNGDSILIPITQKEYTDDTTYRAWVSGYEPRLDSIQTYRQTIVINEVKTIRKRQMINFGVQLGTGYGIFSKQFDAYAGVGVTITIPN